jgi:hypothetical protein
MPWRVLGWFALAAVVVGAATYGALNRPQVDGPNSADGGEFYCQAHACAAPDGLVAARHQQCDIGKIVLTYLATGDNQGHPELDQNLGYSVHESLPLARAQADQAIEACDKNADQRDAQAAQQAAAEAQRAKAEDAQLSLDIHESFECDTAGGVFKQSRCYSTVQGNPSGKPGASCVYPDKTPLWVSFTPSGSIEPSLGTTLQFYPGCFK